ncbi:hypothetical protein EG240_15370 [Paenimyroides tangerinum]|uniref:Uncharacterized protein n=1 Tax=Paenimyroides tangerinum TaxID=2488728 RepID=A0A3P3VWG0_9FLAO|nr:hypothetical protein [Paenimyroides tangerinum]RRJ87142.1 hypothetical protein EG240_15370 [Paenimyroides tangerinum]
MAKKSSEAQIIQNYGVLFENVKKDTILATELAEYGYDATAITQGESLYNTLLAKYSTNKTETAEETTAYANFSTHFEALVAVYAIDRKKAKIVFKGQPDVVKNLELVGNAPVRNASVLNSISVFYNALQNNAAWLTSLNRLRITATHVNEQLTKLATTQSAYATYAQEKGESQQATQDKNKAFDDVIKWVNEFYAVAKIALEDKPQLLESVSKWVRS